MLATLVIGLREGLEASLIVGIIAAFLKRTGKPLRPMWIGVAIAGVLSIGVGIILQFVSAGLPQAQQEGMESIIGLVAVGVVTGMIGWMNVHARTMRADLEEHAASALKDGTAWALVGMAFLAVLKEGFETSVFLLAAFQSSTSFIGASAEAVIGILIAVAIGVGIFRGGVRLNLGRFFQITGFFLVLVAAGLVLSALRTAHEAGWILIGQQTTVNIAWLAPNGSVQAALLTGVLGIPADPRLIEILGWLAYLIPTMLFLLWPRKHRPAGRALRNMRLGIAGALVVAATVLALAVTLPTYSAPSTVTVSGTTVRGTTVSAAHNVKANVNVNVNKANVNKGSSTVHDGIASKLVRTTVTAVPADRPTTLSLTQVVALGGGRLPIGINASQNPGPFKARWSTTSVTSIWSWNGGILDATRSVSTIVTLSGGGLPSSRTISPDSAQTGGWAVSAVDRSSVVDAITHTARDTAELLLWKMWIPLAMLLAALVLALYTLRSTRQAATVSRASVPTANLPAHDAPTKDSQKETYA
jgi:high-affinity iron transporter